MYDGHGPVMSQTATVSFAKAVLLCVVSREEERVAEVGEWDCCGLGSSQDCLRYPSSKLTLDGVK